MKNQMLLMKRLFFLYKRLNSFKGTEEGNNLVEKYNYFLENSDAGPDCPYAKKCLTLFMTHDYEDIKKELLAALEVINEYEKSLL